MREWILRGLSVVVLAGCAWTATVVPLEDLSTGMLTGSPLADSSADPNWSINGGAAYVTNRNGGASALGCVQSFPFCGAPDTNNNPNYWDTSNYDSSRWLSPRAGYGPGAGFVDGNAPGTYDFTRTFQLDDTATIIAAAINFRLEVDNRLTAILVNGNNTGFSVLPGADPAAVFRSFSTSFSVTNVNWLVNGQNTITFRVVNDVSPWAQWNTAPFYWNATGLRVQSEASTITYQDPVPEPSTFALCGFAGLALLLKRRQR